MYLINGHSGGATHAKTILSADVELEHAEALAQYG